MSKVDLNDLETGDPLRHAIDDIVKDVAKSKPDTESPAAPKGKLSRPTPAAKFGPDDDKGLDKDDDPDLDDEKKDDEDDDLDLDAPSSDTPGPQQMPRQMMSGGGGGGAGGVPLTHAIGYGLTSGVDAAKFIARNGLKGGQLVGKGLATGAKRTATIAKDANHYYKKHRAETAATSVKGYLEEIRGTEKELRDQVKIHNEVYGPFDNRVRELKNSETYKAEYSDDSTRLKAAQTQARAEMPYFDDAMYAESKNGLEKIEGLAMAHAERLSQAPAFESAAAKAPEDVREEFKEALDANLGEDLAFQEAAKAATMDGEDNPKLKERMKELQEKLVEVIQNIVQNIVSVVRRFG